MSDLRLATAPPPTERRRALRDALGELVPGWRPLAEDVLGAERRIDWVGCDGRGRAVIALIGDAGEDLSLVAEGLAQRDWVAARLADWAQLAPEAGLEPTAEVLALLLAPRFQPAALAAARAVPGTALQLVLLRFVENGAGVSPLLEPIGERAAGPADPERGAAGFRSGLSPADLDLTPEERAEFDVE